MKILRALACTAAILASASAARAADLSPLPPPPPPVVAPVTATDWAGPYVGVFAGFIRVPLVRSIPINQAVVNPNLIFDAGVQAGYNFVRGNFLVGVEGRAGLVFVGMPPGTVFSLSGRAGVLLGAQDRALLFGAAGIGVAPSTFGPFWSAGGGLEVAVGERWSVFGETRVLNSLGKGGSTLSFQVGINFHL